MEAAQWKFEHCSHHSSDT